MYCLHYKLKMHLMEVPSVCASDFLTRSYDIGGVVSVMALSSLYVLMTQYGIEYPNFYEKLYALLVPAIFMAKHRAKFFQVILVNPSIIWRVWILIYDLKHIKDYLSRIFRSLFFFFLFVNAYSVFLV